jgi:3-hydroxy-9,10-secoandrosta-1,3,5(10)-triene-9,17-dione monooxygenase
MRRIRMMNFVIWIARGIPMAVDYDEIIQRARSIGPALALNANACESARQVLPESIHLMVEAGLFRILQPSRVCGYEMSLRAFADTVTIISEACASSGWVLGVVGAHHWCMGAFPEAAQEEIFGGRQDALIAGTLSWQGVATSVDGGYRVSGRWQFGSGVDHSHWVMLGCADAETRAPLVHVVVPRADIEVDDTWHVMGMRGTGSKDVVARDLFVPAHRTIDTRSFFMGRSPHVSAHPTNLYRLPADSILGVLGPTSLLGMAKAALRTFVNRTRERRVVVTGARKSEHVPTQIRLAESAGEIQCAELLLHDGLIECERIIADLKYSAEQRTRIKWQGAYATELCRRAVGRLFAGSGAHSIYDESEMQVAFRNINVAANHASLDFDISAEQYGREVLGVKRSG